MGKAYLTEKRGRDIIAFISSGPYGEYLMAGNGCGMSWSEIKKNRSVKHVKRV